MNITCTVKTLWIHFLLHKFSNCIPESSVFFSRIKNI